MFDSLVAALGAAPQEDEEEELQALKAPHDPEQAPKAQTQAQTWWSVASALSATVKQRSAELAASIQDTDWHSELTAIQQGLKEDSDELQQRAKAATEALAVRAKAAVRQLPTAVEHLPETGAVLQARALQAGHQLQQAGRSLGTLGQRLLHTTTELFDQINNAVQTELDQQKELHNARRMVARNGAGGGGPKYSRFEADVAAMQRDSGTYCDEPDDEDDFATWHASFDLAARRRNIDDLLADNTFMAELQSRIVPVVVDYELFWTRYFYRLHKLGQRHAQFAALTQRAEQGGAEEEEVGWGSEDEDAAVADTLAPLDGAAAPGNRDGSQAEEPGVGAWAQSVVGARATVEEALPAREAKQADEGDAAKMQQERSAVSSSVLSALGEVSLTARTSSDNSTGSGKEPWMVVEQRPGGPDAAAVRAAAQTADATAKDVAQKVGQSFATASPAKVLAAEQSASLSEEGFALGDNDVDDDADGAAKAGGADDSDWGDDAKDWE